MRKIIFLCLLLYSFTGYSQKNAIKIGLLGIQLGDISVAYERALNENSTINLNFGYWDLKTSSIDVFKYFEVGKGVWMDELGNGFHAALDYRMYMSKREALRGFYIAPYLRYWENSLELRDFINNDKVQNKIFDIETALSSFGFGFQVGYQWLIYDHLSIDWYFMGIDLERVTLNADYREANRASMNYADIEGDVLDVFSNVDFFATRVETTVRADALNIKLPVWLPGIRTGLTIGYAF